MPAEASKCPLCENKADYFLELHTKFGIRNYYKCFNCGSIHLAEADILIGEDEKERYAMHNNDIKDFRYQKFVAPVVNQIQKKQNQDNQGLDYGCGPGPVISYMLKKEGFNHIKLYDPYFRPNTQYLNENYDFIICCEVIEHFKNPKKEFTTIKKLLKPEANFYGKTELLKDNLDAKLFTKWWYKNDPTHCFFYSKTTLNYIAKEFNFSAIDILPNLFILQN